MADHKKAIIAYRRKREGKTDYKKRLKLLKSKSLRLIIRKTNKYLIAQIAEYSPDGDRIIAGLTSKSLDKLDWKLSKNSIPAAYLTGLLLGKKAAPKIKQKEVVVDLGLLTNAKGSRLFAIVKGAKDAGLKVNASDEVFPNGERISGKHIKEHYALKPERFSAYKTGGLKVQDIESAFKNTKDKITNLK
ncbi:MAG: 50S ribosomal protein L18 [Candidatus Woesearchaeota archaeon]